MEQLHAHKVLHMMEGNSYTELSLREAIIQKFGEQQRFFHLLCQQYGCRYPDRIS